MESGEGDPETWSWLGTLKLAAVGCAGADAQESQGYSESYGGGAGGGGSLVRCESTAGEQRCERLRCLRSRFEVDAMGLSHGALVRAYIPRYSHILPQLLELEPYSPDEQDRESSYEPKKYEDIPATTASAQFEAE